MTARRKTVKKKTKTTRQAPARTTARRRVGRPSKRDQPVDRTEVYIGGLSIGLSHRSSAQLAGITAETAREWRHDDERFSVRCDEAAAGVIVRLTERLLALTRHLNPVVALKAIMFFLERRSPDFCRSAMEDDREQEPLDPDEQYL